MMAINGLPILQKEPKQDYWLTRFIILRFLGFVYLFAFISLAAQVIPLLGHNGLLPADHFLDVVGTHFTSKPVAFWNYPTLFWFHISDTMMVYLAWSGVILSLLLLFGFANVPLLFVLWFLYMSFVHVGQLWYSYGWEIQLLETGFLAMFLVPLWDPKPFPKFAPPVPVIWLFRWLTFRIYLGSGLIKIRGDQCWRDLTCLLYHYQTQPIPNPLSPWFHFLPAWLNKLGALWNHLVELIAPWFVLGPRRARIVAGSLMTIFQFILILSGNLSFLNWLTIVPALACFDDTFLKRILPRWLTKKAEEAKQRIYDKPHTTPWIAWILVLVIGFLSIPVILNLFSSSQYMNTSFNRLDLVNTYGAFGSVGKERYELIVEGTAESNITNATQWREYEFRAKPGNPNRQLPVIAPYQPRIDWQIWFAAMENPKQNPWLIHLIWKFLHNDRDALSLIANNPFPNQPPTYIRISFYHYEFAKPGSAPVWNRTRVGTWLSPLSVDTPGLKEFIEAHGWELYGE